MTKKQLNTRVTQPIHDAIDRVSEVCEFTKEELSEIAFATLFGSRDGLIREKRKRVQQAIEELHLSFNGADGQHAALAE